MALVTLTKEQLRRRASRCITEARESEEGHKRKPLQNGGRIPDTWRQQLRSASQCSKEAPWLETDHLMLDAMAVNGLRHSGGYPQDGQRGKVM